MKDKCFCHFNGYEVKDAKARKDLETETQERKENYNELFSAVSEEKTERVNADNDLSNEIAVERARITNLSTLGEGSTTGDAELIDARTDYNGTTHENVGEHIRTVSSQLFSEIAYLDKGKRALTFNDNFTITTSGEIIPYEGSSVSEFLNCENETELFINVVENHSRNAFFDANYNLVSMFTLYKGGNGENVVKVPSNAVYVAFSLATNLKNTLRVMTKESYAISESARFGYNLMPTDFHTDESVSSADGIPQFDKNWTWFTLKHNGRHGVTYGLYANDNGVLTEIPVFAYVVGTNPGLACAGELLSTVTFHEGCEELKISIHEDKLKQNLILCETMHADKFTKGVYPKKALIDNNNNVVFDMDKFEIVNISKPYVYKDHHNYVSFKFDTIKFIYNGNVWVYRMEDLERDIPYVQDYNYEYEKGVIVVTNIGERKLIFNYRLWTVRLDKETTEHDVVLVDIDADGNMCGALVDFYNTSMSNQKSTIKYDSLTKDMLENINTKENEIYSLIDNSKFVFGYIGDNHDIGYERTMVNYSNLALSRVCKNLSVDTIINVGDSVLSGGDNCTALRKIYEYVDKKEVIYCQGNHDRGIEEPIVPQKDFYNMMYRHLKGDDSVHFGNAPATYFYKDFDKDKIRVVVLDLYDIPSQYDYNDYNGYRQNQLQWIVNTALRVDTDWQVMVLTHSSPFGDDDGMTLNTGNQQNRELLPQILESFKNGTSVTLKNTSTFSGFEVSFTADFTEQGARTLIGVFTGHNHADVILNKNGINYISICSGYIDVLLYLDARTQHEYSAICFDVGIIDSTARTVTLKRIGYGEDRQFNY